jgi:hypothetical protein
MPQGMALTLGRLWVMMAFGCASLIANVAAQGGIPFDLGRSVPGLHCKRGQGTSCCNSSCGCISSVCVSACLVMCAEACNLITCHLYSCVVNCSMMGGGGGGGKGCMFKCPGGIPPKPREGHTPTFNGCGAMGVSVQSQFGMTECCNQHDICYHTCKTDKEQKKGQVG